MNIYDFDGTIYDGDSTLDFYTFCLKNYPRTRLAILRTLWGFTLYMFGIIDKTKFKQSFFSFLCYISDVDVAVSEFWKNNENHLKSWYLAQKQNTDIIISASPEFLLFPICEKLGVALIATRVDKKTGILDGPNCHGTEKVKRFADEKKENYENFYSDSITDKPLAESVPNSFIVRGAKIIPWNEYKPTILTRAKRMFFTPKFFLFVFCGGCATIVNFAFSLLYAQKVNDIMAFVGGYFSSIIITYCLNAKLNFKRKLTFLEFLKFVISYLPHFAILVTLVMTLLYIYEMPRVLVYGFTALLGLPISFVLVRIYAFKKDKED